MIILINQINWINMINKIKWINGINWTNWMEGCPSDLYYPLVVDKKLNWLNGFILFRNQ